jgi:hypothetical protein
VDGRPEGGTEGKVESTIKMEHEELRKRILAFSSFLCIIGTYCTGLREHTGVYSCIHTIHAYTIHTYILTKTFFVAGKFERELGYE